MSPRLACILRVSRGVLPTVAHSHAPVRGYAPSRIHSLSTAEAHVAPVAPVEPPQPMVPPVPDPSSRLVRAVRAEQEELARHRSRLLRSRESLLAELERIESGIAQVDERRALL